MLSLLALTPLGAESCVPNLSVPQRILFDRALNVNPTVRIAPEPYSSIPNPYNETPDLTPTQVRIVQSDWPEARLVPHVAGVLIREVLGMDVDYVIDRREGGISRMYKMLMNDEADLALTLWPGQVFDTDRADALSASCPRSSTDRCITTVGNQGYKGRSGWFVPSQDVSTVRENVAEWSTVTGLYDPVHVDQLIKVRPQFYTSPRLILALTLTLGR